MSRDHLGDMVRRAGLDGWRQASERLGVLVKNLRHFVRQHADIDPALRRAGIDLVVDVGDVADIGDMVLAVFMPQQAEEHVEDDQHAPVADVQMIVNRRAAGIEAHIRGIERLERNFLAGQRIVEPKRHVFPLCLLWPGASKSNSWIEDATAPARGKARRYK